MPRQNILANTGQIERFEERKRVEKLADSCKGKYRNYRKVRIDTKTEILVDKSWPEEKVEWIIEKIKKSRQ
ncbi:hypothetical protein [Limibacterium fermenti]|uniref:hypothetical protein n=1 Tax=Limibacterium fermenti TaxID=3229863 RepID=UPI003A69F4B4